LKSDNTKALTKTNAPISLVKVFLYVLYVA